MENENMKQFIRFLSTKKQTIEADAVDKRTGYDNLAKGFKYVHNGFGFFFATFYFKAISVYDLSIGKIVK